MSPKKYKAKSLFPVITAYYSDVWGNQDDTLEQPIWLGVYIRGEEYAPYETV